MLCNIASLQMHSLKSSELISYSLIACILQPECYKVCCLLPSWINILPPTLGVSSDPDVSINQVKSMKITRRRSPSCGFLFATSPSNVSGNGEKPEHFFHARDDHGKASQNDELLCSAPSRQGCFKPTFTRYSCEMKHHDHSVNTPGNLRLAWW